MDRAINIFLVLSYAPTPVTILTITVTGTGRPLPHRILEGEDSVGKAGETIMLSGQSLATCKVEIGTVTIRNPQRVRLETVLVSVGFDNSTTRRYWCELLNNFAEHICVLVTPFDKVEERLYWVTCHIVFLSLVDCILVKLPAIRIS